MVQENTWQADIKSASDKIQMAYGWHWLAKDVADFTGINYYDVYERTVIEVLSTVMVMQARIKYHEHNKK